MRDKALFTTALLFCLASLGKPEGRTLFAKGFSPQMPGFVCETTEAVFVAEGS